MPLSRTTPWQFCSRVRRIAQAVAQEYGVDALAVMQAACWLQERERETLAEVLAARRTARRLTGLTLKRIWELEDMGLDHSLVGRLDVMAEEVAAMLPALGIGQGYRQEAGADERDYAAALWEKLREPDPVIRAQHDESLVRQAAEMVKGGGS